MEFVVGPFTSLHHMILLKGNLLIEIGLFDDSKSGGEDTTLLLTSDTSLGLSVNLAVCCIPKNKQKLLCMDTVVKVKVSERQSVFSQHYIKTCNGTRIHRLTNT